jgi:HprK-related kinase A
VTPDALRTVGELSEAEFAERLRARGLAVRVGPFDIRMSSEVAVIDAPLHRLYRDYPLLDYERVFSMHLKLARARQFPRLDRASVRLLVDGRAPHEDLPRAQALAVLEWGINLVIALRSHSFLMLHSGAIERGGRVMLFPAWPGSGKTTLCAALVHRGWRLFSDEFGLIRPSTLEAVPIPRPMPLKNESIAAIRTFVPDAELGPTIPNTRKGTIAHVKAPAASIREAAHCAAVRWIVFPQWVAGAELVCEEMSKADAFSLLATNAFNYEMLGEQAYMAVRQLVIAATCYRLVYSDLAQVVPLLNGIAESDANRS